MISEIYNYIKDDYSVRGRICRSSINKHAYFSGIICITYLSLFTSRRSIGHQGTPFHQTWFWTFPVASIYILRLSSLLNLLLSGIYLGLPLFRVSVCLLARLSSEARARMASGQGNHWLTGSPTSICPPEICVNLVLNIFMMLAFTQSLDNLFYSFIVLYENEY